LVARERRAPSEKITLFENCANDFTKFREKFFFPRAEPELFS
jgi:hypothetical protein